MKNEVCYLLGAGASAKSLPMVAGIPDHLNKFENSLASHTIYETTFSQDEDFLVSPSKAKKELQESINWVKQEIQHRNLTIDQVAKKFFLRKEMDKYNRLKAVLTCFFTWLQGERDIDNRYDSFISQIADKSYPKLLPPHIKIITWNYDFQFELAWNEYLVEEGLDEIWKDATDMCVGSSPIQPRDHLQILKMNGTAGYLAEDGSGIIALGSRSMNNDDKRKFYSSLCYHYARFIHDKDHKNLLQFAWETETPTVSDSRRLGYLEEIKVLVVIGYSFPFFNKPLDSLLFKQMKKLIKVYVQVPEGAEEDIVNKVKALLPWNPEAKDKHVKAYTKSVDTFFLPPELEV